MKMGIISSRICPALFWKAITAAPFMRPVPVPAGNIPTPTAPGSTRFWHWPWRTALPVRPSSRSWSGWEKAGDGKNQQVSYTEKTTLTSLIPGKSGSKIYIRLTLLCSILLPIFAITKINKTYLQLSIIRLFTFTVVYKSNRSFALHPPSKSDRRKSVGGIRELCKTIKTAPNDWI